jgi:hypothetical protein
MTSGRTWASGVTSGGISPKGLVSPLRLSDLKRDATADGRQSEMAGVSNLSRWHGCRPT